uniref:Uncharacterized protein LOC108949759 n=1 Tax=Phallusia mammillata TaxID=59560 RepID=A0A6F9DJZ0_9ASCI|nr:uncharacterized protein LOC108949759 [Phallusia mammillata]
MRAQRNVRKRAESDRHFGNFRNGVILNKLPSDLIGNYKATFESLNYYLGKGAVKSKGEKGNEESAIVIPTGRLGENPEYEIDEDAINPEFIRHLTHQCDVKMRYAHRSSSDTPSMERMPWEETDIGSEAEMAARNAALASTHRSGSRKVRRLTVKLPEMPYVKQERLRAPPATPVNVPDTIRSSEPCQYCQENEIQKQVVGNGKSAPGLPLKISRKDFGAELLGGGASQGGKPWYGMRPLVADEARILRGEMKTIHEEPKRDLTEQLILAHGEMKRRKHDCSQKEILITPFAVKIDDKTSSTSSSVDLPLSRKPARNDFRSSITKPYTFSYMSANKKRASQARDQQLANHANHLCNSPDKLPKANPGESWYIRNFVNVTPADVNHTDDVTGSDVIPPSTPEAEESSRDKATEPIEASQTSDKGKQRGKRRRRVKLTHPQNAPATQPMVTSET